MLEMGESVQIRTWSETNMFDSAKGKDHSVGPKNQDYNYSKYAIVVVQNNSLRLNSSQQHEFESQRKSSENGTLRLSCSWRSCCSGRWASIGWPLRRSGSRGRWRWPVAGCGSRAEPGNEEPPSSQLQVRKLIASLFLFVIVFFQCAH